jgi:PemK-like, MazF-like toxin of type II toxin-antitoxin system
MKKGEVWRVRMPAVPGHTQAGERPAILLQDNPFNLTLPTVLMSHSRARWLRLDFPARWWCSPVPGMASPFRFLAYSADAILPALATRAGGEAVSLPD